jgi:hypothetical protein
LADVHLRDALATFSSRLLVSGYLPGYFGVTGFSSRFHSSLPTNLGGSP